MINNYEQILNILPNEPEGDLQYYCQIIKRKKDHPGLEGKNNSARLVKPYYFTCKADMEKRWEEMVTISEATGARIMMDAFPKSRAKVKYEMLKSLADIIQTGNDAKLHRLYNTCYGSMKPPKGRALWLIDWDSKDTDLLDKVIESFNSVTVEYKDSIQIAHKIPTRQGWHYMVKPFYIDKFWEHWATYAHWNMDRPDIHKTSPTLVYIPKSLEINKD